jgi:hypothetical protein
MKKLDYNKHYINKSKTLHYYINHTFTNAEWSDYINGKEVQNIKIAHSDKHRLPTKICERWYNQDGGKTNICKPCKNPPYYRSSTGGFFCKSCAQAVSLVNHSVSFDKISPKPN